MHRISGTGSSYQPDGGGWNWRFADAVAACRDVADLSSFVAQEVARHGYTSPACGIIKVTEEGPRPLYLFRNWPQSWISRYAQGNFAARDFIVLQARRHLVPFTWQSARDARRLTCQEHEFWNAQTELGWSDGVLIPIHGPGGYCAFLTMAGAPSAMSPSLQAWLIALAFITQERARAIRGGGADRTPGEVLTRRELECLREVGAGKSDPEIGATLGISRTTVKYYLERARLKLGARTRTQAYAQLVLWGED